ncbi:MAG: hypothetical protein J0H43_08590 [Actinobacteria bacterium]|nr:hypothetical protein [Actinomycetota bacterium]
MIFLLKVAMMGMPTPTCVPSGKPSTWTGFAGGAGLLDVAGALDFAAELLGWLDELLGVVEELTEPLPPLLEEHAAATSATIVSGTANQADRGMECERTRLR